MSEGCVMFAGQSVQEAGMGRELLKRPVARELLGRLSPILGSDLETLLTTTPDPELALTFNAQRAIHFSHVAHWWCYKTAHPSFRLTGAVGHSMGVVAALAAAGAMTVEDSAVFIRARAQAFSDVCKTFTEPMGLAAVSTETFSDIFDELVHFPQVSVALHNTVGRGTLGGTVKALEALAAHAQEQDWPVKMKILKVEGPYHTKAFTPCRPALEKAAASLKLKKPDVPVFMGTSGKAETDPGRIRELLVAQADSQERHLEAVRAAFEAGCSSFIETAYRPQPVTWLSDQVIGATGLGVTTEALA